MKIKKGDVVSRESYGHDILFTVEKIINTKNGNSFVILKGLTIRIEADSELKDLKLVEKNVVESNMRSLEDKLDRIIEQKITHINDTRKELPREFREE